MCSKFIYAVACVRMFLRLDILLYVYAAFCLSFQLLMVTWSAWPFGYYNSATVNTVYKYHFETLLLFLMYLGYYVYSGYWYAGKFAYIYIQLLYFS